MARAIDAEGLEKELLYGDIHCGETFEGYIERVIRQAPTIEPKQEWVGVKGMFSSGKDDRETPQKFFEELNEEFRFTLDPCCTHENAKCEKHYTAEENGLEQDWGGETVFCNPPYSMKGRQDLWIKKCYEESLKPNTTVVALIPARTDTARFHDYIYGKAEIRFLRGRLHYEINGVPMDRPPYPSMVCIWRSKEQA